VPVFAGAAKPLMRDAAHADWFHGADGFGNHHFPPAKIRPNKEHAIDAIIRIVQANPGTELVTLGPLTNIAIALSRAPEIVKNISRCIIMGGNPCCEGNVTPAAEYNIWCDPEAAQIVFRSGMKIELIGWQLCRGPANLLEANIDFVRKQINTKLAHFAIDINRTAMEANRIQSNEVGIALPDPVAMAVAIDPSIAVEATDHLVEIECSSELTRGMTVVDRLNVARDERNRGLWSQLKTPPAKVVWKIDIAKWKQLLYRSLG
jgi:purine nucleosidase